MSNKSNIQKIVNLFVSKCTNLMEVYKILEFSTMELLLNKIQLLNLLKIYSLFNRKTNRKENSLKELQLIYRVKD